MYFLLSALQSKYTFCSAIITASLSLSDSSPPAKRPDNSETSASACLLPLEPYCSAACETNSSSESYNKAFWNNIRNRNYIDVRNDLQIGTDSEGGYLCPDEFEKKLISSLEEENVFRPLATKIQTSSGDRKIPVITQKGEACWMEEEEAYTLSDDSFGQIALSAYKV